MPNFKARILYKTADHNLVAIGLPDPTEIFLKYAVHSNFLFRNSSLVSPKVLIKAYSRWAKIKVLHTLNIAFK